MSALERQRKFSKYLDPPQEKLENTSGGCSRRTHDTIEDFHTTVMDAIKKKRIIRKISKMSFIKWTRFYGVLFQGVRYPTF